MFSKPTLPAATTARRRGLSDRAASTAQLQNQIGLLELQVQALERQLREMRQSTSWRFTAPLRRVMGSLQRLLMRGAPEVSKERGDYAAWAARYDHPDWAVLPELRRDIQARSISLRLVVLVDARSGLEGALLQKRIASVQSQCFPAAEIHVVSDTPAVTEASVALQGSGHDVERIHFGAPIEFRASAVADWIVWLAEGCTMPAHALLYVAKEILAHPDAEMIYGDEDRIDESGNRIDPCFKPDWNRDLFLSRNLFSQLGVVKASVFDEAGGLGSDPWEDGDYDLALRCVERVQGAKIRHIPRILSHRCGPSLEAAGQAAGMYALNRHFERTDTAARAEITPYGYRARYALPIPPPFVSLIIPTRNGVDLVRQCIESIVLETAYPHYEILLIDNGSDDPEALAYFEQLHAQPNITVIRDDRPFNYSALNNAAVASAHGDIIGLLNNDIEVMGGDWLDEMVSIALQPGVGAVGAKLLYPDLTVQHGGILLGVGGVAGHSHKHLPATAPGHGARAQLLQSFSAVTAACLVVRKALYDEVGGLDEEHLGVAYNDVDFCLRLREAGYRSVWTPYPELLHHESASRGLDLSTESRDRLTRESAWMRQRWGALIANDPAYNPNLTLEFEDFGLAWPPRGADARGKIPHS